MVLSGALSGWARPKDDPQGFCAWKPWKCSEVGGYKDRQCGQFTGKSGPARCWDWVHNTHWSSMNWLRLGQRKQTKQLCVNRKRLGSGKLTPKQSGPYVKCVCVCGGGGGVGFLPKPPLPQEKRFPLGSLTILLQKCWKLHFLASKFVIIAPPPPKVQSYGWLDFQKGYRQL